MGDSTDTSGILATVLGYVAKAKALAMGYGITVAGIVVGFILGKIL